MIFVRKLKVAHVVRRHSEQSARAIIHQHEIRDPHRQPQRRIKRVDDLDPGIVAKLLGGLDLGRGGPALATALDERCNDRVVRGERFGDRMAC